MDIEVYSLKPADFSPQIEVAACYLEINGQLLLLQIANKSESGKWGVPAGKLEKNETPEQGAKRELFEETGISSSQIQYLGKLYMRKPGFDYVYHQFSIQLDQIPPIQLSDEHINYKWATLKDLEELPLMTGANEALDSYKKFKLTYKI